MSEVSKVEPLGVFDLDPATNHGQFSKSADQHVKSKHSDNLKYIATLLNPDLIRVSSIINDYAPVLDEKTGVKMKICTHGDQGQSEKHQHNFELI